MKQYMTPEVELLEIAAQEQVANNYGNNEEDFSSLIPGGN